MLTSSSVTMRAPERARSVSRTKLASVAVRATRSIPLTPSGRRCFCTTSTTLGSWSSAVTTLTCSV
eukprot:1840811-Rhodomonas_salina.2